MLETVLIVIKHQTEQITQLFIQCDIYKSVTVNEHRIQNRVLLMSRQESNR